MAARCDGAGTDHQRLRAHCIFRQGWPGGGTACRPPAARIGLCDDWWFRTVFAFAQIELQDFTNGLRNIETALRGNPRNGHAAHIRGHLYYELGERKAGLQFLSRWAKDYPRDAHIHCHISWHQAIWSLETGQRDDAWSIYLRDLSTPAPHGVL